MVKFTSVQNREHSKEKAFLCEIERIEKLMIKDNKGREKVCLFFASDYHFEMISLPYINENLKKDKNIIMITENDLDNTVNKVLENVNLSREEKSKIEKIDWKNNDLNKLKKVENAKEEGKDTIIFIKGKESYINNVNKNIENWIDNEDMKIIDCYDINEVEDDVSDIAKKYNKVLSTSGVEKLL